MPAPSATHSNEAKGAVVIVVVPLVVADVATDVDPVLVTVEDIDDDAVDEADDRAVDEALVVADVA